ncbi:MAG: PcfJ domain-containing protein [Rhodoblastus sp.]|nr:PcfJ domain-containing protein [Rhodoblastus sp.]
MAVVQLALVGARGRGCARSLERRIARFPAPYRSACRALARRHAWLEDIAFTFPALLLALAAPRRGFDTAPVIAAAEAGARLPALARAARVPMWLRRLPPDALEGPLPELPDSEQFARQIANALPTGRVDARQWLNNVALAHEVCGPGFAAWTAREFIRKPCAIVSIAQLRLVGLWAWFSAQPETDAGACWPARFTEKMSWGGAWAEALQWARVVESALELGERPVTPWIAGGSAGGFEFAPLTRASDLRDEARAMRHCVAMYGDQIAGGHSRLYSVRRDGERVATLELALQGAGLPVSVAQILGPCNKAPAPDVVWAAHDWVHKRDLRALDLPAPVDTAYDNDVWRRMWRPYWLERRRIPHWLPLRPYATLFRWYGPRARRRRRARN